MDHEVNDDSELVAGEPIVIDGEPVLVDGEPLLPVEVDGELINPAVPGSMANYEPPTMTPEQSNDANNGYTETSWLEQEALFTRE